MKKRLEDLTTKQIVNLRLNQLNLNLKDSWVYPLYKQVCQELADKGIPFKAKLWVADDWFSPDGSAGFALPFYLLHPKLMKIEKANFHEVEGGKKSWCLKLIRHEFAHALDNAYDLRRLRKRQKLFGLSSKKYPTKYRPNPESKKYVRHLDGHYAQAHPEEDWAETFAVWLDPKSNWRKKYKNWPALKKLEYLDDLMKELKGKAPKHRKIYKQGHIKQSKQTVKEYLQQKRERLKLKKQDKKIQDFFTTKNYEFNNKGQNISTVLKRNRKSMLKKLELSTHYGPQQLQTLLTHSISISKIKRYRVRKNQEGKFLKTYTTHLSTKLMEDTVIM